MAAHPPTVAPDSRPRRRAVAPDSPHLRRGRVRIAFVALLVAAVTAACGHSGRPASPPGHAASSHPNIVFVLTDDLATNLVTRQFMPNLWALEHQGASFSHYFVTDSLCCPSRASIFTGRYPHDTGVYLNAGPDGGITIFNRLGDQYSTVALDLQHAGYRTAMMGKYLNRYSPQEPPAPGWNQWDVTGNQGYGQFNYDLRENNRQVHYGGRHAKRDTYLTDVLSGFANGFIRTSTSGPHRSPFFLEVATFAPHAPYTPAPKYANLYPGLRYPRTPAYDRANTDPPRWLSDHRPLTPRDNRLINDEFRKRAQSVKSVDDMIGRLVATLKKTGVWDNTYLVFSSDNGLHMGEHRLEPGKLTAFDTDVRVPLIIVGPHVPKARLVVAFAENIDLRSTFDAWAGTVPGEGVDGRSLVPVLTDPQTPAGWPTGIVVEHRGPDTNDDDPDRQNVSSGDPTSYVALRLTGALYVQYLDGEREYYDLVTDPYEIHNVYPTLPAAYVSELHAEIKRIEACHDAPACSDVVTPAPPT